MGATITPANYVQELGKVDLPYFKELVKLVCLMKLVSYIEARQPKKAASIPVLTPFPAPPIVEEPTPNKITVAPQKALRSYEPKLTQTQYALLAKCFNRFEVFRRNVNASVLRELFEGKESHVLQVTNQRTLTYILDELVKEGLIRKAWIAVAKDNGNFISGPRRGVETAIASNPHYITAQQFSNCRNANQYKFVEDMDDINEAIGQIAGK